MNIECKPHPVELLAPAGNLGCALAAYDAGADAVYAGLKRFNARERTENFSLDEMSKLLSYAHKNGRKVYITFNTLIKESEIVDAAKELAELNTLRPDAIIVQDLGVLRVAREYFPNLTIHGSTQMGLHNSAGLSLAKELGITRVILERQTTLQELDAMMRSKPPVEVEVFIHGALCCCISGTCLLSSWLGGWSGNRGKCKQPCRRRHRSKDGNGFFLSSQDLCTLEILPQIMQTGISSMKIEGRLRRADYVSNVVAAYRMAMDAAGSEAEFRDVLPAAKECLAKTCGRKWSLGYYTKDSASHLIKYDAMGVSGQLCGKVLSTSANGFTLSASRRIHIGDTIRIQPPSGDEGPALCITKMSANGVPVRRILKGETCFIHSDKEVPRDGMVYKTGESVDDYMRRIEAMPLQKSLLDLDISVSRSEFKVRFADRMEWVKKTELQEAGKRPLQPETIQQEFLSLSSDRFAGGKITVNVSENPFLPASVLKSIRYEFRDYLEAHLPSDWAADSSQAHFRQFQADYAQLRRPGDLPRFPVFAIIPRGVNNPFREKVTILREIGDTPSPHEELLLPFFVNEPSLKTVRDAIRRFAEKGGKVVRISSLHHLELMKEFPQLKIRTCMPLPVCNSMAIKELQKFGIDLVQAWLELEKPELEGLTAKSVLPVEIYRYGRPPLLSTRASLAVSGKMSDSRGNDFRVEQDGILTQVMAEKVMEIPVVKGASANLFDLRHAVLNERDTGRFNFDFALS